MKLRSHPLISYRNFRTWPPVWTKRDGACVKMLFGEFGVLTCAYLCDGSSTQCCLLIDYENQSFGGALLFDNPIFCNQICRLLEANVGRSLKEIGDLDLSFTL